MKNVIKFQSKNVCITLDKWISKLWENIVKTVEYYKETYFVV